MKTTITFKHLAIAVAAVALLSAAPAEAEAGKFSRSGKYTTGKGHSGAFKTEGTRSKGAWSKNKTVTTEKGKVFNRGVTGAYDKDTRTTKRSVTGWSGKTHTTESTYDRKSGAFSGTATNEKGKTLTATGTAKKGQRDGTWTGSEGKSGTYSSSLRKNGDGSYTRSNSTSVADGKTYTTSKTYSYDKETKTLNGSYTGAGGKTHTGSVTFDKLND